MESLKLIAVFIFTIMWLLTPCRRWTFCELSPGKRSVTIGPGFRSSVVRCQHLPRSDTGEETDLLLGCGTSFSEYAWIG
jgi:hypothetical protein